MAEATSPPALSVEPSIGRRTIDGAAGPLCNGSSCSQTTSKAAYWEATTLGQDARFFTCFVLWALYQLNYEGPPWCLGSIILRSAETKGHWHDAVAKKQQPNCKSQHAMHQMCAGNSCCL